MDLHAALDIICQISLALFLCAWAWFLLKRSRLDAGRNWFDRWAGLKDDDQLMLLAMMLTAVCIPLAVAVVVFVLIFKPVGYDTLIGSLVTSLLTLGGVGMAYFFNQGHAGKKSATALAEIAAMPSDSAEEK